MVNATRLLEAGRTRTSRSTFRVRRFRYRTVESARAGAPTQRLGDRLSRLDDIAPERAENSRSLAYAGETNADDGNEGSGIPDRSAHGRKAVIYLAAALAKASSVDTLELFAHEDAIDNGIFVNFGNGRLITASQIASGAKASEQHLAKPPACHDAADESSRRTG